MRHPFSASAALLATLLIAPPALADKPAWAGNGKHERQDEGRDARRGERDERRDERRDDRREDRHEDRRERGDAAGGIQLRFDDRQRGYLTDYYARQAQQGNCPPGLAKKHNGCLPPGQARKWSRGRALPSDVAYYDLPDALIVQIGRPPAGYRYVRVANDVLMVTVGSMMVVDALEDLGVLGGR